MHRPLLLLLVPVVAFPACDPIDPAPAGPGAIDVTVATSGSDLDWDGYQLFVPNSETGPQRANVGTSGTARFSDIPDGPMTVELERVAENCAPAESNPAEVTVPAGGTADVTFNVTCVAHPRFAARQISAGDDATCAVTASGEGYCWGHWWRVGNYDAPSATGCGGIVCVPEATLVSGGHDWSMIRAGTSLVCGLTPPGTAYCWGNGVLGDGDVALSFSPRPVSGDRVYRTMDVGSSVCVTETTGETWCWGGNARGEIGDGTVDDRKLPVRLLGDPGLVELALGYRFACGRDSDGLVYCWGDNTGGQLGRGTADPSPHPNADTVAGGLRFAAIEAGPSEVCGLTEEGAAYCWGHGHGTTPAPVAPSLTFSEIAPGEAHTCGLTTGGALYCWGYNGQGQVGVGNREATEFPPTEIGAGSTWLAVNAGTRHTCALREDGLAFCWGADWTKQLGTWGPPWSPSEVIGPPAS